MSGTSLDGVDAALVRFTDDGCNVTRTHYVPYSPELKQTLLQLHTPSHNELEHSQLVAILLAHLYAEAVNGLKAGLPDGATLTAVGCHGQTIRHRPELGFTLQLNNPAFLAELTDITVVADFRSRDIAAGGQGAPLVPAFHADVFAHPAIHRTILNIGGISNLTDLPANGASGSISGFDCGLGNLLMDAWCQRHTGQAYDKDGAWAAGGTVIAPLLAELLAHPFFTLAPPKSTGRDMFNMSWLEKQLLPNYAPQDVQATLLEFSARGIADAMQQYCRGTQELYLCGGGAHNGALRTRLSELLPVTLALTDDLGIDADWVEAAAFAWLAKQTLEHKPGNLPSVTGASGYRVLGAIYPAS
jgi:anhydro-N-acetylmuramic acid kinase